MTQAPIQVLLSFPDTALRSGLARLLEAEPDLRVEEQWARSEPHVVVTQVEHSDQTRDLRRLYPRSRILARLSPFRPELRSTDVDAWVDNVAPYEVLLNAIRKVARSASP